MGQQTCKICGIKGHSDKTCGLIDASILWKERNSILTSLNAKADRKRRNEDVKRYREKYPDRVKESARKLNEKLRLDALVQYGGMCTCCGFSDLKRKLHGKTFLEIDHIQGGGRQHRKEVGNIYQWLKNNNYPDGYRVLCRGCNNAMEPNGIKCILHTQEK